MGTMMGRLPCSLVLGVEVDGVVEESESPFLEFGKEWELLARSGEASLLSDEGGIFGNKFSLRTEMCCGVSPSSRLSESLSSTLS